MPGFREGQKKILYTIYRWFVDSPRTRSVPVEGRPFQYYARIAQRLVVCLVVCLVVDLRRDR
jgi:hypothetical protein